MAFFDDFANAVGNYPSTNVILAIVDVAVQNGTPGAVNVNEVWRFQVRVSNNGHLNLTNVRLHIVGQNGAQVGTVAAGPFSASVVSGVLNVNAHGSQDTVNFFFKAPAAAQAAAVLVRAHIQGFDVNLNHILNDHSGHSDPPAGTHSAQVHP